MSRLIVRCGIHPQPPTSKKMSHATAGTLILWDSLQTRCPNKNNYFSVDVKGLAAPQQAAAGQGTEFIVILTNHFCPASSSMHSVFLNYLTCTFLIVTKICPQAELIV
jgi:hypothetical protein